MEKKTRGTLINVYCILTCSVTCMLVSVTKFGRYDTKNGVQSPPKATGFPSRDTSVSEVTSASEDMSSTLKFNEYNTTNFYFVLN